MMTDEYSDLLGRLLSEVESELSSRDVGEDDSEMRVRVRVPFGHKLILNVVELNAELLCALRTRLAGRYGCGSNRVLSELAGVLVGALAEKTLVLDRLLAQMSSRELTSCLVAESGLVDLFLRDTLSRWLLDGRGLTTDDSGIRSSSYAVRNRRTHMEDFWFSLDHVVHPFTGQNLSIHLVVDGHGGADTALYAVRLAPYLILSQRRSLDRFGLREIFKQIQSLIAKRAAVDPLNGGCTASVVLVVDELVYVCWLGDTSVLVIDASGSILFRSAAHKPDRKDEFDRITRVGGVVSKSKGDVFRINGVTAVSRSLGDLVMHPYVSSEPEIQVFRLNGKRKLKYVLVGTDGFADHCSNNELLNLLFQTNHEKISRDYCARLLVSRAQHNDSSDNICVTLVDLAVGEYQSTFSQDTADNQPIVLSRPTEQLHMIKQRSSAIVQRPRIVVCEETGLRGYVSD